MQLQTQRLCHAHNMHTIQDGWFIIRTMNGTNSTLNTSDIIYTTYCSIRNVIINRAEFLNTVSKVGSK